MLSAFFKGDDGLKNPGEKKRHLEGRWCACQDNIQAMMNIQYRLSTFSDSYWSEEGW